MAYMRGINPRFLFYFSIVALTGSLIPSVTHIATALSTIERSDMKFVSWAGAIGIEAGFLLLGIAVNTIVLMPRINPIMQRIGIKVSNFNTYYKILIFISYFGNIYAGFLNQKDKDLSFFDVLTTLFMSMVFPTLTMIFLKAQSVFFTAWTLEQKLNEKIKHGEKKDDRAEKGNALMEKDPGGDDKYQATIEKDNKSGQVAESSKRKDKKIKRISKKAVTKRQRKKFAGSSLQKTKKQAKRIDLSRNADLLKKADLKNAGKLKNDKDTSTVDSKKRSDESSFTAEKIWSDALPFIRRLPPHFPRRK